MVDSIVAVARHELFGAGNRRGGPLIGSLQARCDGDGVSPRACPQNFLGRQRDCPYLATSMSGTGLISAVTVPPPSSSGFRMACA